MVKVPRGTGRVVSLAPNVTEIVIRLAGEGALIGRTAWCPVSAAGKRTIPVAGSMLRLDAERMVRLRPRVVLLSYEGSPAGSARLLERLGIPAYVVRIRSVAGLVASLTRLAGVLEVDPAPELARLRQQLKGLQGVLPGKRLFFHIPGGHVPWTFGGGTLLDDLVRQSGAVNCGAAYAGSFPRPSREALLRLQADRIIVLASRDSGAGRAASRFWARTNPGTPLVYAAEEALFRPGIGQLAAFTALVPRL